MINEQASSEDPLAVIFLCQKAEGKQNSNNAMFSHERELKDSKPTVQALPRICEKPPMNGGHPFQGFDIV